MRAEECRFLVGAKSGVKECEATCLADAECNAVMHHAELSVCELLFCDKLAPPVLETLGASGWAVYVYDALTTYDWVVGDWSACTCKAGNAIAQSKLN